MTAEKLTPQLNGWAAFTVLTILVVTCVAGLFYSIVLQLVWEIVGTSVLVVVLAVTYRGFFIVEPNQAVVMLLFGKYKGTETEAGLRWTNPLRSCKRISLRACNFDSDMLKVNDKKGNPIEISAVVVWRVQDTAHAVFDVDDYAEYVHVQAESAVRHLATSYPYDATEGEQLSLRSSIDEVSRALGTEIQKRVAAAGVSIDEARINHLAYAPEIAQAMLQRQQAEALIAARTKIVDGAVGMVEMALNRLQNAGVLELDEERKANMVSNLMVVLCSHEAAQPIINTGSLY